MAVGRGSVRGRRWRGQGPAIRMDVAVSIDLTLEGGQGATDHTGAVLGEMGGARFLQDLRRAITWEGQAEEEQAIVPPKDPEVQLEDPQIQVNT